MKCIERDKLIESLQNLQSLKFFDRKIRKKIIDRFIVFCYKMPTIEAVPVEEAEWIPLREGGYKCSHCNCMASLRDHNLKSTYCPWCGKKMKE